MKKIVKITKSGPRASGHPPVPAPAPTAHALMRWFRTKKATIGKHPLYLMTESPGARAGVLNDVRDFVRSHYVDPKIVERRIAELGAPKTAKLLRDFIPTSKTARSGDFGELLSAEIAEQILNYKVPIRRLRWKDGRNMALRGDDIIGLRETDGKLGFLKGESKSRVNLSSDVLDKAGEALDRDRGRPSRHAVLFIATRLREQGKNALAVQLEKAVLDSFSDSNVEHLLLAFTGRDPKNLLAAHLTAAARKRLRRHAVGIQVVDHGAFIALLFNGL